MPQTKEFTWTPFAHGFTFWEIPDAEHSPPGPLQADELCEWLECFCMAHADCSGSLDFGSGESTEAALNRLLAGHPALPALLAMLRPQ